MAHPRKHMKIIEQQKEAQSISLDYYSEIQGNDVIQEYGNLEFSDQISVEKDDRSSDEGELSADKLKFLGVDKFPGSYKHQLTDHRDTGLGETPSMNNELSRPGLRPHQRSRKQKPNLDPSSFNIDSFLNSRPSNDRNNRQKHNTNAFGKVITQQRKPSHKIFERRKEEHREARSRYEEKNNEIKDFIRQYNRKSGRKPCPCPCSMNSSVTGSSEESITLITLPELPGPAAYRNQNKEKIPGGLNEFQVRLEQARINFLDAFLPQSMKIGSNPYNFLRYMNSKPQNIFRVR